METTGALQGQGYLRERRDDQAQGEEDQIVVCIGGDVLYLYNVFKAYGRSIGGLERINGIPSILFTCSSRPYSLRLAQ